MLRAAALLTLTASYLVIFAGAVITAQNPLDADLTGGEVGTIRDVPPNSEPTGEGPGGAESRWRTVSAKAQKEHVPDPGVPLPEFLEVGCAGLGSADAAQLLTENCTDIQDHGGSRVQCTAKCGELAVGGTSSATALARGPECRCCLTDDLLEVAEWIDSQNCDWLCPDQDDALYKKQPFKAQRRFADPWTCGGEQDTWTAFRQYDAVSPLGRRGAYSTLFGAWYEVVVMPERLLPGAHPLQSLDDKRWNEHPGFVYYINAVHLGLGWPIFWHQVRLPFAPECLHVDERGRLMALARRNIRVSGTSPGYDALIFDVGCGSGFVQEPQVIPALDTDAHASACTFDIERAVLAFVANPNEGMGSDAKPQLVEVDVIRGAVSSKSAKALEKAVALEQCRQTSGGTASRPSLSALVVSDGLFSVVPPQGLAGMGSSAIGELAYCGNTPDDTACKLPGPDRFALQMQTTSHHATLPFMHVATEFEAYYGAEFDDEASAQLAKLPCEPGAGESAIWPSSAPGHHRRRGANLESPHILYRHKAHGTTARRCIRGLLCNITIEGVGVTGDDHLVAVRVTRDEHEEDEHHEEGEKEEDEKASLTCDLRGALIRSIAGGSTEHEYFQHVESSELWGVSPFFNEIVFSLPGLFFLCYYTVPACSGNISDAVFSGISGERVGLLPVKGPKPDQALFCVAYNSCRVRVDGYSFDEPMFAYLGANASCAEAMDGEPGFPWTGQPWEFSIASALQGWTWITIPQAMPLASTVICFCAGTQDGGVGPFLGKCEGPGVPFGNISSSLPSTDLEWILPGNFRADDPPSEYRLGGQMLSETNRLVIVHLDQADEEEGNPCAGENLDEDDFLAPSKMDGTTLTFLIHSMTPDEGFKGYGMPDDTLQLSMDKKVLRSSYMIPDTRFAICYTDKDVARPLPDALRVGTLTLETSVCGDGFLVLPEICDDGNTVSGDGCAGGCEKVEEGWIMWHNNTEEGQYGAKDGPLLEEICGDGMIVGVEGCDDNNTVSGDGCDASCTTERGWTCIWLAGLRRSFCTPICGDFILSSPYEGCDDGNREGGDGCSPSCEVEVGYTCSQKPMFDLEKGVIEESVSFCQIDCSGNKDVAALVREGIYPCQDGTQPPSSLAPHWCVMFPRTCADMPPYEGPHERWLGCTQAVQQIKAQCKVIMPPVVNFVSFHRSGTGLDVTLSQKALVLAPPAGQATCSVFFEGAAEALGQGAACRQSSETLVEVTLGRKPKLRPFMNLTVLPGALYLDPAPILARTGTPQWPAGWPYVESLQHGTLVWPPLGGFEPLVAKLQSQRKIGLGSDIELVASDSSGGGGQLEFYWGVLSVELNPVWGEGFFSNSAEKEQRVIAQLREVLLQALLPFDGQPVALVPAEVVIEMDEILLRAAGLEEEDDVEVLEPILVRFNMTAVSLFDGQRATAEWLVEVYQYAVPLVKRETSASVTVPRDQPVSLLARVIAPGGLPVSRLPSFQLSWRSSSSFDVKQFVAPNPGLLKIPGLTFPRGRWTFNLSCVYNAPGGGGVQEVVTSFVVTFDATVPVPILDGPENSSAACNTSISADRSYDPGLVVPGTKTPITPVPSDRYQIEWECWWLGFGQRSIQADARLVEGLMATALPCSQLVQSGITANGTEFAIVGGTFRLDTLLVVRMRLKPVSGRISPWSMHVLRLLSISVPSVSFPQVPVSPLRPNVPHQVWALSVSSTDCPQTGSARPSLLNVGQNTEVAPLGDLPAVELIKTYEGLENVPAPVRAKVLANSGADAFAGRVLYVFWLRIRADVMQAGYRYRLILRGEDESGGSTGWSSQTPVMEANAGPRGGSLSVRPLRGKAVETIFRLSVAEWEDPHIPLNFIFWLRRPGGNSSSQLVLADWSESSSVLIPLPVGNWTVISRARDRLGVESDPDGDLFSEPVEIDEAPTGDDENLEKVSLIVDRSTDASQLLSSVSSVLDAAVASSARRLNDGGANGTNGTNSPGVSAVLAGSMLKAMDRGQKFLVGAGSKSGASRQASMLLGISSGIGGGNGSGDANGTDGGPNETQMASDAAKVLGSTFSLLEGAEDSEAPTGVNTDEAKDFVATASALSVMEVPDGSGGRRLAKRNLDVAASNTLGSVVDGIGRQLAQSLVSQNGSAPPPPPIQTPGLTVAAAALPVVVGQTSPGGRRLGGMEGTDRVTITIPGIGTFGIPVEALQMSASSLSEMGYEGSTSAGMSANQWGGNPFGPRERKTVRSADCGGAGANGSFLFGKNLSLGLAGNASANSSDNSSQGSPCSDVETTEDSSVESNVVSVSLSSALGLSAKIAALHHPITISMTVGQDYWKLNQQMGDGLVPQCMWWDPQTNSWGGDGCKTLAVRAKGKELLCSCTHLTSFGAFAEEGANVLAGSNFDVLFDFSYESLRADNPTMWFVLGIFFLQIVWLCLGIWADHHGFTGGTEEQMKKIYFKESGDATGASLRHSRHTKEEEGNITMGTQQKLQARMRDLLPNSGKPSPTLDLLHFRNMIRATLEHHNISWLDLSSKRVRTHVHDICKDEVKHALTKGHDETKTEGHKSKLRKALLKMFRRELCERLASQMGRKALTARGLPMDKKTRRHEPGLPTFPWSFQATLKVTCRNVHPLEKQPEVRQQLRVDEVLEVLVVADEYTVKIFIREGDVEDADDLTEDVEPFIEVSWLAIADHEGIVGDRPVEAEARESSRARVAERLEERAASALVLPPQRYGRSGAGEYVESQSARVGELCDEWEDEFLARMELQDQGLQPRALPSLRDRDIPQHERDLLPLPPPPSGRELLPLPPPGRPPPLEPYPEDLAVLPPEEELTEELDDAPQVEDYLRWVTTHEPEQGRSEDGARAAGAESALSGGGASGAAAPGAGVGAEGAAAPAVARGVSAGALGFGRVGALGADTGGEAVAVAEGGGFPEPGTLAAVVAPPGDGDSSEGSSMEDTVSDVGRRAPRSGAARPLPPPEPPPLAQLLQDSGHGGDLEPNADGVLGDYSEAVAEAAVEDWEESMMLRRQHVTPRLAIQAGELSSDGRGLDFWRCGGTVSEACGMPPELLSYAMLFIISASPPEGDEGDMSWVTSGWFFAWAPLQTRELRRLQNQARQAASAAGRQAPEVPARVEILLCGLQPRTQAELRAAVPKLVERARKEEEATRENLERAQRRRAGPSAASETEDEDDSMLSGWNLEEDEEEDARMRALEARWSAPSNGDLQLARTADRRRDAEHTPRFLNEDEIEGMIFVGLPDRNELPIQAHVLVQDVRWNPMHMSIEESAANEDNVQGRPAVLRFSDIQDGDPRPFSGWAVPMGRISNVRVLRQSDYPLPPLDSSVAAADVQMSVGSETAEVFDIDALAQEAASGAPRAAALLPHEFPEELRELVEIVVAPRSQSLYRILLRPCDGAAAGADRLAYHLKNAVEAWQKEDRLRTRPRLAELSRVGQLERQAEDLRQQAREAEDEAKKDKQRRAEKYQEDMKEIENCIDLLFRRYEFILWDPITLMRRTLLRDHPMTGIFVPHLRSFAVERVLIFSCALAGSLMAAGLFYDAGAGGSPASAGNSTAVNATDLSSDLESTTTTTTTTLLGDASANNKDPWSQIMTQVWVSGLSVLIAGIPAGTVWFLFKRQVMTDVHSEREKKRILRWWKTKRRVGYAVALVFLAYCYFFLWQFAMNRSIEIQRDFASSSAINLIWKIVLKPVIVFLVIAILITTVRMSSVFDSLMFLVPFSALDFTMFTAKDVDDLLDYEQLVEGFMDAGDGADLIL